MMYHLRRPLVYHSSLRQALSACTVVGATSTTGGSSSGASYSAASTKKKNHLGGCGTNKNQLTTTSSQAARRNYHTTKPREVLPIVIAAGLLLGVARYSYKALKRMDAEWDDYQWALQQYEKQLLKAAQQQQQNVAGDEMQLLPSKSVAIDLGTVFTKLAATHPTVQVVITREGDRSFFNGIVYNDDDDSGDAHDDGDESRSSSSSSSTSSNVQSTGRSALERFYYHHDEDDDDNRQKAGDVILPFTVLAAEATGSEQKLPHSGKQVVSDVLTPALTEVLDRLDMVQSTTTTTTTASDRGMIRKVVTLPTPFLTDPAVYKSAFGGLLLNEPSSKATTISFVPEPVAAVWGAQFQSVLPDDEESSICLVVDIGGFTTQLSLVKDNIVVHASTILFGGEDVNEQMVNLLKAQTDQPLQDARSLALLQVQARQAVAELSTKSRVAVHVPYLFADPANHHLDTSIARTVLEQAVENAVRDDLTKLLNHDDLSPHMPKPNNMTTLWTSVITQVLERSETLPGNLDHVLLVGGGAKFPLSYQTLLEALQMLMGPTATDKLKRPDASIQAELTVLGAATLLPSFEYSLHNGLIRRDG